MTNEGREVAVSVDLLQEAADAIDTVLTRKINERDAEEFADLRAKIRAALENRWPVCDGCKLDGDCSAQRGEIAMGPGPDGKCIHREGSDDGV